MSKKENLKQLIIRECNGLVGALRMSVQSLTQKESGEDVSSLTENDLIVKYLSKLTLGYMKRCFGGAHMSATGLLKEALIKCIFEEPIVIKALTLENDKQDCYKKLLKCGILTINAEGKTEFSSPMALKYYMEYLFPERSSENPVSIKELVMKVIEGMSASVLRQSVVSGEQFPKEAVFQHLFMQGLVLCTLPNCVICPELSWAFPSSGSAADSGRINGEIDFYLNGGLRWGIELLVNGAGVGEHIGRFSEGGKYFALKVIDYAVVDFRGNDTGEVTNVELDPKRMTVFFRRGGDASCQCIFYEDTTPVPLKLAN